MVIGMDIYTDKIKIKADAVIGTSEIKLHDVLGWKIGSTIMLSRLDTRNINLEISGNPIAKATIYSENNVLKIEIK